ncbi:hypothetical protein [Parvibaculum sp.]|uniref:hypothetical protein n=1 Tax=Parvibaculum sp. TaxID=2024848 RepID=UPI002C5E5913|nr:hypothetical protein [Parvibaculum sp.]HUD51423.1 hypothetical protein [Parvibaculum sp.]
MTDAYVIEIDDEAAGIIVRTGRDYYFYASNPRYAQLEGTSYTSPSKAEIAARALTRPLARAS